MAEGHPNHVYSWFISSAVVYAPTPEERAVPDRHLAVVPGEHVEAHRGDPDVERLRRRASCWWRCTASGRSNRRTRWIATATIETPNATMRCGRPSSHPLHARRPEQPGGAEQQHEQDQAERHQQVQAVGARRRIASSASRPRRRSDRRRPRRTRCRTRRAPRPRTRTRGSPASTTGRAPAVVGITSAPASNRPQRPSPSRPSGSDRPGRRAAGSTPGCWRRRGRPRRASCAGAARREPHSIASIADEDERVRRDEHGTGTPRLLRVGAGERFGLVAERELGE